MLGEVGGVAGADCSCADGTLGAAAWYHAGFAGWRDANFADAGLLDDHTRQHVVGTALGLVSLSANRTDLPPLVDGQNIKAGDAIIGLLSSGLHSNGYSLARKVLLHQAALRLDQYLDELGRTLGEELLEPTFIYVDAVLPLLRQRRSIKGVANVSGGGLLSLGRLPSDCSYLIERLPRPQPIFTLIQDRGSLPDAAMFAAFNMGVGLIVVCASRDQKQVRALLAEHGETPMALGHILEGDRTVRYVSLS